MLCSGETGLGKSTLMDSLFNTNFESSPSPHSLPTVKLKAHTYELQESNVRLKVKPLPGAVSLLPGSSVATADLCLHTVHLENQIRLLTTLEDSTNNFRNQNLKFLSTNSPFL